MELSSRIRLILGILGLTAATVLIGVAIYFSFFRSTLNLSNRRPAGNGTINGALPNANEAGNANRVGNANRGVNGGVTGLPAISDIAQGGDTKTGTIVNAPTADVTTTASGREVLYYDPTDGKFYKISADGQTRTVLSETAFRGVEKVTWSTDKTKAILSFPDDSKILYDFATKKQTTLPKELSDFSFSPDSSRIAAKFTGETADDNWLVVSNPDGSSAEIVESLGAQADRVTPAWSPNNQVVATFAKSAGTDSQEIVFLGKQNENFKSLPVEGRGFQGQWSTDGSRMLYSVHTSENSYTPELYIADAQGEAIGQHKVKLDVATFADKCAFGSGGGSLYCAVPQYLPPGAGLRPETTRGIPDSIVRVDLRTGVKTTLARPVDDQGNSTYSIRNLLLADGEGTIVFTDWVTGKIHRIRLR